MKSNILPATIVAAAILFAVFFHHWASMRAASSVVDELEASVLEKDSDGKTRVATFVEGAVSSVKEGFTSGLSDMFGSEDEKLTDQIAARSLLALKEIRLVRGDSPREERVIGVVRNEGTKLVKRASANVTFRDSAGTLIDVKSSVTVFDEPLEPGSEIGFEIERSLGEFEEDDDVVQGRRASSVEVTITSATLPQEKKEG